MRMTYVNRPWNADTNSPGPGRQVDGIGVPTGAG